MPALSLQQTRAQVQRAEDRIRAIESGERPWDRPLAEQALKMARTKLANAGANS